MPLSLLPLRPLPPSRAAPDRSGSGNATGCDTRSVPIAARGQAAGFACAASAGVGFHDYNVWHTEGYMEGTHGYPQADGSGRAGRAFKIDHLLLGDLVLRAALLAARVERDLELLEAAVTGALGGSVCSGSTREYSGVLWEYSGVLRGYSGVR